MRAIVLLAVVLLALAGCAEPKAEPTPAPRQGDSGPKAPPTKFHNATLPLSVTWPSNLAWPADTFRVGTTPSDCIEVRGDPKGITVGNATPVSFTFTWTPQNPTLEQLKVVVFTGRDSGVFSPSERNISVEKTGGPGLSVSFGPGLIRSYNENEPSAPIISLYAWVQPVDGKVAAFQQAIDVAFSIPFESEIARPEADASLCDDMYMPRPRA